MNIIEKKKIALLKGKIALKKKAAHDQGKFSLFDTQYATDTFNKDSNYKGLASIYEIIEKLEDNCNLSYGTGISLDKLASDNIVMCHRTNLGLNRKEPGLEYNEALLSIMSDGLKNYGHMNAAGGSAFSAAIPSLTVTMTPLKGLTGYVNLLSPYKDNDAIILCAFPKEILEEDGDVLNESNYSDIYNLDGAVPSVKKEYMLGVILKKNNGLDEFYTRDEVIEALSQRKNK